jgi:hypothetical protein
VISFALHRLQKNLKVSLFVYWRRIHIESRKKCGLLLRKSTGSTGSDFSPKLLLFVAFVLQVSFNRAIAVSLLHSLVFNGTVDFNNGYLIIVGKIEVGSMIYRGSVMRVIPHILSSLGDHYFSIKCKHDLIFS